MMSVFAQNGRRTDTGVNQKMFSYFKQQVVGSYTEHKKALDETLVYQSGLFKTVNSVKHQCLLNSPNA